MKETHQIHDLMGVTMEKIRDMVDVQTIIRALPLFRFPKFLMDLHPVDPIYLPKTIQKIYSAVVLVPVFLFSRLAFWWYRMEMSSSCKCPKGMTPSAMSFVLCRMS